jgi:hypothetical protein
VRFAKDIDLAAPVTMFIKTPSALLQGNMRDVFCLMFPLPQQAGSCLSPYRGLGFYSSCSDSRISSR